ncbi:MAG: thiamine pyrophosphate-dependent enzyme [Cyclobacteriaceae bacterium]|nr:thiamine pyrophosphate-dependent enzyme [Cyclobacteriaceae bacterium]
MGTASQQVSRSKIKQKTLLEAYRLMCTAQSMAQLYEDERAVCSKYVHSTSRGHEAIQLAAALQIMPQDYLSLYYRDDSFLLGLGMSPFELMLQLLAKADDPFSGGRSYYCHPSLKREGFPTIPHQSSATGMQAIPATGMAHGLQYLADEGLLKGRNKPLVLCSLGDGSVTEGEVSEAFQMAALKQLPILYLIQDNDWGISATGDEMRSMDAYEFIAGFKGIERMRVDGSDFVDSYLALKEGLDFVRKERRPLLIHAKCPLLGHHTSGVRKEWYRSEEDLQRHAQDDPITKFHGYLLDGGVDAKKLEDIASKAQKTVHQDYQMAVNSEDPDASSVMDHEFAPTPILKEKGLREPDGAEKVLMVDAALYALDEILQQHPEALLYGQDVGGRLGGVFREAANLTKKYGVNRVFNTPIQEAYIVGSTAGMSAVGCKPVVEIQFADYIWPGLNQLVEELSKSCYLSRGQFPVQSLIRVPIGAYGGGGPYHSGSVESTLLNIRGIKVVFPSNAADMKGLFKAAFYDPNPVVMLEHKGLYWSKVPGTEAAKIKEPDAKYIIPLGKARMVQEAQEAHKQEGRAAVIVTYGMGVYWSLTASKEFSQRVSIIDLRTLNPLDWEFVEQQVQQHHRCLVLTEEPILNSFAESLAGRISNRCWEYLDAPVAFYGADNLPAVPLNVDLEAAMLPNAEKVREQLEGLLNY